MLHRALKSYQTLQTETDVRTASPAELIVLVYDRVLDHLAETHALFSRGHDAAEPIQKTLDLITEGLIAALDRERGGEVADNLGALYDWAVRALLRARLRKDAALIEDVQRVFLPLRAAWADARNQEATIV
ncbi:MAG: hypothetical protein RIR70_1574 [Pseudomonadota bacterium]|jgi:flagellar protein FliS